ncbi:MAG: class I tRNA ligase family protein, partial [Rhodospirillales bacterium]
ALEEYRFNDAAGALYTHVWGVFCDWYLEFSKPLLSGADEAAKAETRATFAWARDQLLIMLHPIMPFITSELWDHMGADRDGPLMLSCWPELDESLIDAAASAEMDWVVRLITSVRAVRSEMNVPPGATIPLSLKGASAESLARLERHGDLIRRLARLESAAALEGDVPAGSVQQILDEATIVLPIADVIDIAAEKARLEKEIAKLDSDIMKHDKKLANPGFVDKAPEAVVETERERRSEAAATRDKLAEALDRLAAL